MYLLSTLQFTEQTNEILKRQCEEALFVLKPWPVEMIVKKEIPKENCSCGDFSSFDNEAEYIATGIGKALLYSQQLRDKLTTEVNNSNILQPELNNDNKGSPILFQREKAKSVKSTTNIIKSKISTLKSKTSNLPITSSCNDKNKNINQDQKTLKMKRSVSNSDNCVTKTGHLRKSSQNKNFLLENKLKIKKIENEKKIDIAKKKKLENKRDNLMKNTVMGTNGLKDRRKSETRAATISELHDLLETLSIAPKNYEKIIDQQRNCLIHGDHPVQYIQEQISTSIDIVDGLDRYGVSSEIVKVMKIYHSFLAEEFSKSHDDKNEKSFHKFLTNFNDMTAKRKISKQFNCSKLITEILPIFREWLISNELKAEIIQEKCNELISNIHDNNIGFKYSINFIDEIQIKSSEKLNVEKWMSNGIWNSFHLNKFDDFSKELCIRYTNLRDLSSLFDVIQKLQRAEHLKLMVNIILTLILPTYKNIFNAENPEHIQLYKMISIISQGLNPKVPVLVRTDK